MYVEHTKIRYTHTHYCIPDTRVQEENYLSTITYVQKFPQKCQKHSTEPVLHNFTYVAEVTVNDNTYVDEDSHRQKVICMLCSAFGTCTNTLHWCTSRIRLVHVQMYLYVEVWQWTLQYHKAELVGHLIYRYNIRAHTSLGSTSDKQIHTCTAHTFIHIYTECVREAFHYV